MAIAVAGTLTSLSRQSLNWKNNTSRYATFYKLVIKFNNNLQKAVDMFEDHVHGVLHLGVLPMAPPCADCGDWRPGVEERMKWLREKRIEEEEKNSKRKRKKKDILDI